MLHTSVLQGKQGPQQARQVPNPVYIIQLLHVCQHPLQQICVLYCQRPCKGPAQREQEVRCGGGGGWEGGSARATQTSHTSTGEPELPELYQPKSSLQYRDFQQPAGILTHQMTSLGAAMQIDAGHKATYRCRKMLPRYMHVEVRHAHVWVGSPVVHNNWLGP